jgi:hypothetical protein
MAAPVIIEINGVRHSCLPIQDTDPDACFDMAYRGPFSKEDSMIICEGAFSDAPALCAIKAFSRFSRQESIDLCRGAYSIGPAECVEAAYAGPFSRTESFSLCSSPGATLQTAQCAIRAFMRHTKEESIRLCKARSLNEKSVAVTFKDLDELIVKANLKAFANGDYK